MVLLPYPSFQACTSVDEAADWSALACVGRCRIHPSSTTTTTTGESASGGVSYYHTMLACNIQLADVDLDSNQTADNQKELKKNLMKEGVQKAQAYLMEILKLDVSIVNVQVFLSAQDVIRTDGCLASCFLDAGCQTIVMDGTNLVALDAAKIPRERLMAHFDSTAKLREEGSLDRIKPFCYGVSVDFLSSTEISVNNLRDIIQMDPDIEIHPQVPITPGQDLAALVGQVCQGSPESSSAIGIINPTARELGSAFAACLQTDRHDGLFTTVVCTRNGEALGLVYSSTESIVAALESGRGVYYSRSRQALWRKGDTSGHFQKLHRLDVDCDRDAVRFTVTQCGEKPAFCHLNTLTCWGSPLGLRHLEETLQDRLQSAPEGSYTKRLFDDAELLRDKLVEEAQELSEAESPTDVADELADVLYFAMVRAVKAGVSMDDAISALDRRARKVTRRPGDSKAFRIAAGKAILDKQNESKSS